MTLAFILMVVGFVVYEILSEWASSKAVSTWAPPHLVKLLFISAPWNGLVNLFHS